MCLHIRFTMQEIAKLMNVAVVMVGLTLASSDPQGALMPASVPLETDYPASQLPRTRYPQWPQESWDGFSTLTEPRLSPPTQTKTFPTGIKGDPVRGEKLVADRSRGGSCFACHIFPNAELPGNIGPDLSTIGDSDRSDAFLFDFVYDPRRHNPDSAMPPWGTHGIFDTHEILDIVAYLRTLTKSTPFVSEEDDPATRPIPVQNIDNLDEFENPGMSVLDDGEELYAQICASCHQQPEAFKAWATTMPKFEPRLGKVLGVAEFITRHARATTGAAYPMESGDNVALSVYLRFLANGESIHIDTSDPDTAAALRRGQELVRRKIGQLNFACADCHETNASRWIRGNYVPSFERMVERHPLYRTSRGEIWDIRKRMQWCNVSIRANELPADSPEYGDIELYLTTRATDRKLSVPGYGN